jgi:ubiquitin carboxyl-terminal hydrolase 25/28
MTTELLAFSYYAQCRCHPRASHIYFQHLNNISDTLSNFGAPQSLLQEVVAMERSRDRFTTDDVERAAAWLGFGINGPLRVEYDESDVEESCIVNSWGEWVYRSGRDLEHGSESLREANEALRILAEARGSEALRKVWETGRERVMNPERAYDVLEVPKDVDEMMLITVFNMRVGHFLFCL